MVYRFVIVFVSAIVFAGCHPSDRQRDADYFILRGQLDDAPQRDIVLQELTTSDLIPVDSFQTDSNGFFSYRGRLEEAGFFIFRTDPDNHITLVIEPGEEITIRGRSADLPVNHTIQGSRGSDLLSGLNRRLLNNYRKVDSLAEVFHESQYQPEFFEVRSKLDSAYRAIFDDQQQFVKQFIRDNPRSLASIIALYQYFGNQLLLRESEHFEYFELLSRTLSEAYPTNRHVLDLNRRVGRFKRQEARRRMAQETLAAGTEAPEIVLPDTAGELRSLSALRGKYVLIDFWAAWCAPCREANPRLRDMYETYREYGFEIFGISLDRTREQWLKGIEEDGITWTQVSDLRFWNSPVIPLYDVQEIPYAVLVDPEGRILRKGIGPDELEEILSALFGA